MKKRILALFTALILTLLSLPLPVPVSAAGGSGQAAAGAYNEADDFARYGIGEEYAIVPCCAGASCIDLNGTNGSTIMLYRSHRKVNQIWTVGKVGDYYYFKCKWNGKVIDVSHSDASSGRGLIGYSYHGSSNQLWRLESLGDGTYAIHSKLNDSLVWDVWGAGWNDNTSIALSGQHNAQNQRFRFVHTSSIEPMSEWGASRHDCSGSNWSVWDGTSCSYEWYDKDPGAKDMYIDSAAGLAGLMSLVINGHEMLGKTIHLTRDINLARRHWTPIGFSGHWFRGSFNGHNHAIIGMENTNSDDNCGLFGLFSGGTICNLAVKGTIKGDDHVGGIVGLLQSGHLCNIYSEVTITNATDIREGGIVGAIAFGGLVDHCTQNAAVTSTDFDPHRGGIAGYSDGVIRYCVNNAAVNHNWNCGGGIVGTLGSGVVEFCANHGKVGCCEKSERIGGIVGETTNGGIILGCYNDGEVCSLDDDYIGGICGKAEYDWLVICCINNGRVYGDDQIGGICGMGRPIKCLNMGVVTGDAEVGGISGDAKQDTPYCYALAYSAASLSGNAGDRAEWVTASEIMSGKVCYQMNMDNVTYNSYGVTAPLTQNIGSDPFPAFGSSEVTRSGDSYQNRECRVTVECERGYGSVEGAGSYSKGSTVTLTAIPAAGCVFDHFEVKTSDDIRWTGFNGGQYYYPSVTVKTYKKDTIKLTDSIDKSYTVRAVFKVFDDTPEDMKVKVKLELVCVNEVDGWNSNIISADLVDSAGDKHHWDIERTKIDEDDETVSREFNLGSASPVAVNVTANFGGGFTFHDYALKARMWLNGSGRAIESEEVKINSYPFTSSIFGGNYMHLSFENFGNSVVGGSSYSYCTDAWERAKSDPSHNLRLESAWLLDRVLEVGSGQTVNLDLNGYPVIRTIKKTQDDGELFLIREGGTLNISDSTPTRASSGSFTGGSIQGGRSDNTAGLIECLGTLTMNGGTLYNGGTTDKGGALKLSGSASVNLSGVLISDCWSDKAVTYQNDGGAIYMKDSATATLKDCTIRLCRAVDYGGAIYMEDTGNRLNCENVSITSCKADENQGGGVYQDEGETNWFGGKIAGCRASEDNGGGFYQNNGKVYMQNVSFEDNYAEDNGGAFYSDAKEGLWFINCSMHGNRSDDIGGAIYNNQNKLYMEDCSVYANASRAEAGGIYQDSSGTIGVAGKTVIRGSDGSGSMDNLVLEKGALLYNHGLEPGSEIHLRSESNGDVKLGGSPMSDYQLKQYFRADHGKLELMETQTVDTGLRASVFSKGTVVLIIGPALALAAIAAGIIYKRTRQKGGEQ